MSRLTLEWSRIPLGTGIGLAGIFAEDIDRDGEVEIVTGGAGYDGRRNRRVFVLARDGGGYGQEWASFPYPATIAAIRPAQLDGDPPLEILVASGANVFVLDGASRAVERIIPLPPTVEDLTGFEAADVDADGAIEIVACDTLGLYVLHAGTGAVEWQASGMGGLGLAVGQIDADAGLEIVVAKGTASGTVVDGRTRVGEWSATFGHYVRVADLDGDGLEEVVAGAMWGDTVVYEGDTHAARYSVPVGNLGAVETADTDGNGSLELVYGDAQHGAIHVVDGSTGVEMWSVHNPDSGATSVAAGDVDGDGVTELLWGAGHRSTGPDHLHVADCASRAIEWRSLDLVTPFYGLDHGDVDGDGNPEILYAAVESESGYADGLYFVHDAVTKRLEHVSPPPTGQNWTGLWRIRTANVDDDPQREIFITSSVIYNGTLICQDGSTHAEQWRFTLPSGLAYRSLQVGDVDGDGLPEVVAGMGQDSSIPGVFVDVYDAASGALEWRSPNFNADFTRLSLLRLANLDADPALEIVVGAWGGILRVLDAAEQAVTLTTADIDVTALDTPDLDVDGRAEIVVGTAAGHVRRLDPATGAVVATLGSWGAAIDGLAFEDLNDDGLAEQVLTAGGRLRVLAAGSWGVVLTTDVLGDNAGAHDSLLVADVDGDSRTELMLNADGVLVFEFAGGPDVGPPTVALTSPAAGAVLAGVVTLVAAASDDWVVGRVDFLVDGVLLGTDFLEPFEWEWDTVPFDAGPHVLEARARDDAGHEATSGPVPVTLADAPGEAAYDTRRRAPTCPKPSSYCDSGPFLVGRWQLGPEPNWPNTVNGSCWDGGWGAFHFHGSSERVRVSSLDGKPLAAGKRARVEAWVWGGRPASGRKSEPLKRRSSWKLDVFAAASDAAPAWFHVATVPTTATGPQKVNVEYTLPVGRLQVVRVRYRYFGRAVPCDWGPWNDHDDLVFSVR
jgi:hypothetical protein